MSSTKQKNIILKSRKPKLPFPITCGFCFDYKLLDALVHFNSSLERAYWIGVGISFSFKYRTMAVIPTPFAANSKIFRTIIAALGSGIS